MPEACKVGTKVMEVTRVMVVTNHRHVVTLSLSSRKSHLADRCIF